MKNKYIIILVIVLIIIFFIYFYINSENNYNEEVLSEIYITDTNQIENTIIEDEKIKIHIIGNVKNPGIYELSIGSRLQDAIISAGGETVEADLNKVNLAYALEDGQKIYIPSIHEEDTTYIDKDGGENVIIEDTFSTGSNKININKATSEELQTISGIGPALAEKIIEYRETQGKFTSIEDLNNVSGIGEKIFEKIKNDITVK